MSDSTNLNNIFDQIIHSENEAQAKRQLLTNLKNEIQTTQTRISEAKEECLAIKGQIFMKNQKLSEEKVSLEHEQNKSQILDERKREVTESKEKSGKISKELESSIEKMKEDFCEEANIFREEFGFPKGERKVWEEETKKALAKLKDDEKRLLEEVLELKKYRKDREEMTKRKADMEKELEDVKMQLQDVNQQLHVAKEKLRNSKEKRLHVMKIPHYDPEFQRLRMQLEKSKVNTTRVASKAADQQLQLQVEKTKANAGKLSLKAREQHQKVEKKRDSRQNNIEEYFSTHENNDSAARQMQTPLKKHAVTEQQKWKFHQLKMHNFLFPGKNS